MEAGVSQPHRPLPGLPGLRHRLPERGALRHADRADAGAPRREDAPVGLRERAARPGRASRLFPHPRRLRALSWPLVLGIRPSRLAPRVQLRRHARCAGSGLTPARGERRITAALLQGCVQRVFFGRREPYRRAESARCPEGCEVVVPPDQGCCGALALHAGREVEARKRALATIAALRGLRPRGGDRGRLRLGDEGGTASCWAPRMRAASRRPCAT